MDSEEFNVVHVIEIIQDAHDIKLETYRDTVMAKQVVIIQKVFRGYFYRKRFLQLKYSTIVLQRAWRARRDRIRFIRVCFLISRLHCSLMQFKR
jgi:myosin heavy subunit